ncbi:MAG: hypothetical protein KDK70_24145 [Myxococcales bacterium]|nr:hypothetical protein [Myxococcales bacterium]
MNERITTAFALTVAALYLGGCGKEQPPSASPDGGDAAPVSSDASDDAGPAADASADAADVKCFGINECAGQSACDVAGSHDCGGQNSCKGKGWILVPATDCETKGGKVL